MLNIYNLKPETTNIGNDIIQIALHAFIKKVFKESINIITLPACEKGNPGKESGISAQSIYTLNRFADAVIIGGGNLFENGGMKLDLNALQALEVPLMLFSVSWGRIYNRHGLLVRRTDTLPDNAIQQLCQKSLLNLVRDNATQQHLNHLGIGSAEVIGCPTLYLNQLDIHLPEAPMALENTVLISVRAPSRMCVSSTLQQRTFSDILAIRDMLVERGYTDIKLLCHDYQDIPFAASFSDMEYIYVEDSLSFLAILKACRLNISYRLHSFVPCLSFGTPCIPIIYDERADSVLNTFNLKNWGINLFSQKSLVEQLAHHVDNLEQFPVMLEQQKTGFDFLKQEMIRGLEQFYHEVKKHKSSF